VEKLNRKALTVVLSLALISCFGAFYFASAKEGGNPNSPWESILDVFVTGGEVGISGPVELDPATHVDVSGAVSLEPGQQVGITGDVSLVPGTEVEVSGPVSIAPDQQVRISGPVTINGPVTLAPGATVETVMATEVVELFYGRLNPAQVEWWFVDVDGYKTIHVYFLYDVISYPDSYALAWDFSIPNPYGGHRLAWNTEYRSRHLHFRGHGPAAVSEPPRMAGRGPNRLQGLRVRPERVEAELSLFFFTSGICILVPCCSDRTNQLARACYWGSIIFRNFVQSDFILLKGPHFPLHRKGEKE